MSKGQFLTALQEGIAKAASMPKCRGCGKMLEAWEQDPMQGGNVLGLCVPRATKQTGLFWEQAEARRVTFFVTIVLDASISVPIFTVPAVPSPYNSASPTRTNLNGP